MVLVELQTVYENFTAGSGLRHCNLYPGPFKFTLL